MLLYIEFVHRPNGEFLDFFELRVFFLDGSIGEMSESLDLLILIRERVFVSRDSGVSMVKKGLKWLGFEDKNVASDVEFLIFNQIRVFYILLYHRLLRKGGKLGLIGLSSLDLQTACL